MNGRALALLVAVGCGSPADPAVEAPSPVPTCPGPGEACDALPPPAAACPGLFEASTDTGGMWAFPHRLSETGCFRTLDPLEAGAGLAPFAVASPLWSDDSGKRRWLAVPPGETVELHPSGPLGLPVGAVLVKQFDLGDVRVETRLMVLREAGWAYASYAWTADGADAVLVPVGGRTEMLAHADDAEWRFPSLLGCSVCHGRVGEVLGPTTEQLNRTVDYGHVRASQLVALEAAGWLAAPLVDPSTLPALADPRSPTASLERRARAYLHANCAHCHRPGGFQPPELTMDLRFDTPLSEAGLCGEPASWPRLDAPGPERVAPGDPAASQLLQRMRITGLTRMPSAGTVIPDPLGIGLIEDWIRGMGECR